MNREELGNIMTVRTKPAALVVARSNGHREDGGNWQSKMEPHVGLEFDSADEAQEFYSSYATQVGFKIRIGQLYRSRVDGSVISRRFVCSKEGFQTSSRTGCQAFIRVQKVDSGKWVLANIKKEHNHEFEASAELCPPRIQRKSIPTPRSSAGGASRTGIRSHEDDDPSSVADMKRLKREDLDVMVGPIGEPYKGLEFNSANEAYKFYHTFAANAGFRIRIGQLFRSKHDGSITSRRFVCSKEGHQHPSRVGCGAYMRIQRQESGRWMVDRLQKEHNHEFETPTDPSRTVTVASKGEYRDEGSSMLENLDLVETNGGLSLVRRVLDSNISKDWYSLILEYFQSRQAEDTGFFYGVELREGKGTNIFWADSRSRFSCTQFGDAVIFDTSYRRGSYLVPFASFVGVNHHRQPVLLGCALVADESEQSFTWIFQTFLTAMSGHHPVSIIADLDQAIQHSIARVFPGTLHRFSAWQVLAKEQENLGALFSMDAKFKSEYEACIRSQAASEFDSAWNKLMDRYNLRENPWFKEMYRTRKSWVPLHLKGTFFAGIPMDGSLKSYFGTLLTPRTTLNEFIVRYEKAVEQRREEERKEDFNSFNIQAVLHTKDPIEEQCRSLYTMTMFKVFQKEFLESFSYAGMKINVEGAISRYLVQRCPNGDERTETNTVAFNTSNLNISCNCKMFEFEGVLCRHALRVFNLMNVRELPSRYILHRWSKSAKYGILRDAESGGGGQDFKALMVWSLREEARNYIEAGASSLERYKLAFEIMQEGRRNLCWQN